MRVVLDTNVLISALFFAGLPGRILGAWIDERFELLASVEMRDGGERGRIHARRQRRDCGVIFEAKVANSRTSLTRSELLLLPQFSTREHQSGLRQRTMRK
jgi:hypothetical protein